MRAENGAGTSNTYPTYEGGGREPKMLHAIESNEGSRTTETRLAMDSDAALFCLSSLEELLHDVVWWGRSIQEIEINVLDAGLDEFLFLVLGLIQTHNEGNSKLFENGHIVIRCERSVLVGHILGS